MSIGIDLDYLDLAHLDCDHMESSKHKIYIWSISIGCATVCITAYRSA